MELSKKVFCVCAITLFEIVGYIDCLHLIPTPYPCCNHVSHLPEFSSGAIVNIPTYNPFSLHSETDPFASGEKIFGLIMPPPFVSDDDTSAGYQTKAYSCSLLPCLREETSAAVCACNFNTGNVVTFKNSCDVKRHNCRFDTGFKVILNEICPWEFESRRSNKEFAIDYKDPKYYNK